METETTSFLKNFVERIFKDPQSFDNYYYELPSLRNNKPELDIVRQQLLARKYSSKVEILEIIAARFSDFYKDICTRSYADENSQSLFAEDYISGYLPEALRKIVSNQIQQ